MAPVMPHIEQKISEITNLIHTARDHGGDNDRTSHDMVIFMYIKTHTLIQGILGEAVADFLIPREGLDWAMDTMGIQSLLPPGHRSTTPGSSVQTVTFSKVTSSPSSQTPDTRTSTHVLTQVSTRSQSRSQSRRPSITPIRRSPIPQTLVHLRRSSRPHRTTQFMVKLNSRIGLHKNSGVKDHLGEDGQDLASEDEGVESEEEDEKDEGQEGDGEGDGEEDEQVRERQEEARQHEVDEDEVGLLGEEVGGGERGGESENESQSERNKPSVTHMANHSMLRVNDLIVSDDSGSVGGSRDSSISEVVSIQNQTQTDNLGEGSRHRESAPQVAVAVLAARVNTQHDTNKTTSTKPYDTTTCTSISLPKRRAVSDTGDAEFSSPQKKSKSSPSTGRSSTRDFVRASRDNIRTPSTASNICPAQAGSLTLGVTRPDLTSPSVDWCLVDLRLDRQTNALNSKKYLEQIDGVYWKICELSQVQQEERRKIAEMKGARHATGPPVQDWQKERDKIGKKTKTDKGLRDHGFIGRDILFIFSKTLLGLSGLKILDALIRDYKTVGNSGLHNGAVERLVQAANCEQYPSIARRLMGAGAHYAETVSRQQEGETLKAFRTNLARYRLYKAYHDCIKAMSKTGKEYDQKFVAFIEQQFPQAQCGRQKNSHKIRKLLFFHTGQPDQRLGQGPNDVDLESANFKAFLHNLESSANLYDIVACMDIGVLAVAPRGLGSRARQVATRETLKAIYPIVRDNIPGFHDILQALKHVSTVISTGHDMPITLVDTDFRSSKSYEQRVCDVVSPFSVRRSLEDSEGTD